MLSVEFKDNGRTIYRTSSNQLDELFEKLVQFVSEKYQPKWKRN